MLKEFKEFALKGSVLDMAIGIVIGGAFSPIVKSLVDDVLMPPIGMLVGGVDFSNLFVVLRAGAEVRHPGRGPAGGGGDGELRRLRQHRHHLHHRRLCHLHHGQEHQPVEAAGRGAAGGADDQEVRLL